MNKLLPKSMIVFSFITFFCPIFANDYSPPEAFDDPWDFMRQEFVTKIDDYMHRNIMAIFKICALSSGILTGSIVGSKIGGSFGIAFDEAFSNLTVTTLARNFFDERDSLLEQNPRGIICTAQELPLVEKTLQNAGNVLVNTNFYTIKVRVISELISKFSGMYLGSKLSSTLIKYLELFLLKRASFKVLKHFLDEWEDNKPYTPKNLRNFFKTILELYERKGEPYLKKASLHSTKYLRKILREI